MAATILTTADIATRLDTDAKTLRRFFRSSASPVTPVGQGNRYALTAGEVRKITKSFQTWHSAHTRHTNNKAA